MLALAALLVATGLLLWVLPTFALGAPLVLLLHVVAGAAAVVGLGLYLPSHLRTATRSPAQTIRRSRRLGGVATGLLLVGLSSGALAVIPRDRLLALATLLPRFWVPGHGAVALLGVAVLALHRLRSTRDVLSRAELGGVVGVLAVAVAVAGFALRGRPLAAPSTFVAARALAPETPLAVAAAEGGAPSLTELAETRACGACHADIVAQWTSSAHRYASFVNPFYLHALRTLERTRGRAATRFCAGCHDPLPLLAGVFDGSAPLSAVLPHADRGVTCLVCHEAVHAADPRGNGALLLAAPSPLLPGLSASPAPSGAMARWLTRIDPAPHRARLQPAALRTSAFCASCHKVGLPEEVTGWRFVRGFNDADPWQQSSSSHEVALPFGAAKEQGCADCHMPRVASTDLAAVAHGGRVKDHRFAGANLTLASAAAHGEGGLPADPGASAWLEAEQAMLRSAGAVAVPIGAAAGGALVVPLAGRGAALPSGEEVTLHVLVTAPGVGHLFPGGTLDSNETWVELEVKDERGRLLARHGAPLADGGPDEDAHVLRSRPLDERGEPIVERDAFRGRTTLYNHAAVAGAGELVRYRLRVDAPVGATLTVTTRLWFRKFSRAFYEAVYRARGAGAAPVEPRLLLDERHVTVRVAPTLAAAACDPATTPLLARYAPSATLQGDVHTATLVARAAQACGLVGPGTILEARAALRANLPSRALALVAPLAKASDGPRDAARMVQALAATALGDDRAALDVLDALLPAYPRDRELHRARARVLLRTGHAALAVLAAERALAVDPEDAAACYVEMLAAAEAHQPEVERRARACYERYREDETQRALRSTRRAQSRADDLEAEPIHVHAAQVPTADLPPAAEAGR